MNSLGNFRPCNDGSHPEGSTQSSVIIRLPASNVGTPIPKSRSSNWDATHVQIIPGSRACRFHWACNCLEWSYRYQPPRLKAFFGQGYMIARNLPFFGNGCKVTSCEGSKTSHLRIRYVLPIWITIRLILISATSSPSHAPELSIKVPPGEFRECWIHGRRKQ